jgi:hypothetical protein
MFHMANDSALFEENKLESLIERGYSLDNQGIFRKGEDIYLPLWEGKFFHQFDHRFGSFQDIPPEKRFIRKAATVRVDSKEKEDPYHEIIARYWVNKSEFNKRASEMEWHNDWIFAFRNVTNTTTNYRTAIGTITKFFPYSHGSPVLIFKQGKNPESTGLLFTAFFNSTIFDYLSRQFISGPNFTLFILEQLSMPTLQQIESMNLVYEGNSFLLSEFLIQRALHLIWTSHALDPLGEIIAPKKGPFSWNDIERRILRAEIDATIAHVYGVTKEEYSYILDTFTILRDKNIEEFGNYKTKNEYLEKYEKISIKLS